MTNGPSNQNLAEPWQPESSRARFSLRSLPECELEHSHHRGLILVCHSRKVMQCAHPIMAADTFWSRRTSLIPVGHFIIYIEPWGPVECLASALHMLHRKSALYYIMQGQCWLTQHYLFTVFIHFVSTVVLWSQGTWIFYAGCFFSSLSFLHLLPPSLLPLLLINFTSWFENLHLSL